MGYFLGVAVGAVAGVLLAPDKGVKTREKLPEYKKQVEKVFGETKSVLKEATRLTKEELPQEKPLAQSDSNPKGKEVYEN